MASVSYADDVGLAAEEWHDLVAQVQGYLDWCALLHLKVHVQKTQIWSLRHPGGTPFTLPLRDGPLVLVSRSTFRMVGVELGASDPVASRVHLAPRLAKALLAGKRLARLPLPAGVMAHIWRAVVLPQALHGCEARSLPAYALQAVRQQGLMVVPHAAPLRLSHYKAAEVVGGLPLGDSAIRDISEEALSRRLQWLLIMANQPGLVGTVHRCTAGRTSSPRNHLDRRLPDGAGGRRRLSGL